MHTDEKLLTSRQTAAALGVHWNTTKKWRSQGRGPDFVRRGRSVFYTEASVEQFRQTWRRPAVAKASLPPATEQGPPAVMPVELVPGPAKPERGLLTWLARLIGRKVA